MKNSQYFHNIREMEWAIDLALRYNKPVAATMCIGNGQILSAWECSILIWWHDVQGPQGDGEGYTPGECAVRMAKAGAPIIGMEPFVFINTQLKRVP